MPSPPEGRVPKSVETEIDAIESWAEAFMMEAQPEIDALLDVETETEQKRRRNILTSVSNYAHPVAVAELFSDPTYQKLRGGYLNDEVSRAKLAKVVRAHKTHYAPVIGNPFPEVDDWTEEQFVDYFRQHVDQMNERLWNYAEGVGLSETVTEALAAKRVAGLWKALLEKPFR